MHKQVAHWIRGKKSMKKVIIRLQICVFHQVWKNRAFFVYLFFPFGRTTVIIQSKSVKIDSAY